MGFALFLRTVVVTPWLAGLFWHGGADARTVALALALGAVWAFPLLRRLGATSHKNAQRGLAATNAAT
ncbi:hypothetical protein OWR29_06470 [Actinoplanes sp. Pm04-4]|uniref:Uncharacterized protein n=1 Tax=Paractinoplanes pyxinae TaxID=2997416 RepID=A0ABT4ATS0_9ACTN|nr:hypothetical protein [Actinoplanes pyxinae]MCY1137639.1 hypothetical protein [Actinoplanes pyxinae]